LGGIVLTYYSFKYYNRSSKYVIEPYRKYHNKLVNGLGI